MGRNKVLNTRWCSCGATMGGWARGPAAAAATLHAAAAGLAPDTAQLAAAPPNAAQHSARSAARRTQVGVHLLVYFNNLAPAHWGPNRHDTWNEIAMDAPRLGSTFLSRACTFRMPMRPWGGKEGTYRGGQVDAPC